MKPDAVFISDLHLGPDCPEITARFQKFCSWAVQNTDAVYILGDFFHAWPGDDYQQNWILPIYEALDFLNKAGIKLYFMHGNRDFLTGKRFFRRFNITLLSDPTVIRLNGERVLLSHGDKYCTRDRWHQWFRRITRNRAFPALFLLLPLKLRKKMVMSVRKYSERNKINQKKLGVTENKSIYSDLQRFKSSVIIHGHTHKPALRKHMQNQVLQYHYILSDWDDSPLLLCYNRINRFYFLHLFEE